MKRKILIGLLVSVVAAIILWDGLGGQNIAKTWHQPSDIQYAFLKQNEPIPTKDLLRLTVSGRQSPIRFWDLDNTFELTVTYGGYIFEREVDLIDGQDDYGAYLNECSVNWQTNAISFVEPNGVELNLPITMLKNRL